MEIFIPGNSRGHANHGWLDSYHTFSFADYYDPKRVNFGALRVLNEDVIAPGMGFGTHGHDNMEIITIPLTGSLAHKDSMGNSSSIIAGEVQVMSAGTGVRHSEYNASEKDPVHLLQIWVFPRKREVAPRYDQKLFDADKTNTWQLLVSADETEGALMVHQDTFFSMTRMDENTYLEYKVKKEGNGVFFMLLNGKVNIGDHALEEKDAFAADDKTAYTIQALEKSQVLAIEVPMEVKW
ncbi:MAG: pirin family protein [Candidatus Gracilibacteria bacterium]